MKKFLATLAVLVVIVIAPASQVQAHTGDLYWARVVNCNEWISLREYPSTSAPRLARIPLGTLVKVYKDRATGGSFIRNGFYQTLYDGMWGYCLADYIRVGEYAEGLP